MNGKRKGKVGEKQACQWFFDETDLFAERKEVNGEDIVAEPFCIEVKRVEKLDVPKAWFQCTMATNRKNRDRDEDEMELEPLLMFRKNNERWSFAISARHIGLDSGYVVLNESTFKVWLSNRLTRTQ